VTSGLSAKERRALLLQLWVSRGLSPLWVPAVTAIMVFVMRWRLPGAGRVRRDYARLRRESETPVLVCANHLTMYDSFAVSRALGGSCTFVRNFHWLPWNMPEETNFTSPRWKRALVHLFKCVPVKRGSNRAEVAKTLEKIAFLLSRGESVLIFPEGGRSRTGRVDRQSPAYGVGRVVNSVQGCRVFCVYLRGRHQETWAHSPVKGEAFDVYGSVLEPKTDHKGLRGSVDVARQVVDRLAEMERRHFDVKK